MIKKDEKEFVVEERGGQMKWVGVGMGVRYGVACELKLARTGALSVKVCFKRHRVSSWILANWQLSGSSRLWRLTAAPVERIRIREEEKKGGCMRL